MGEALEPFRKNVVLATKFFLPDDEVAVDGDLYTTIRRHLEASLRRLRTDYVDLYYLHRVNENIPLEDVADAVGRLIDEGVIRGWDLSQVTIARLAKAHAVTPVTAVQSLYSMVERDLEENVIPFCAEHRIGVVPFSPIASGFLSGKVTTETKFEGDDVRKFVPQLSAANLVANQPILDVVKRFAEEKHATPAQISLAWMLHKYPHVVPIPGSKNRERILENLGGWNVTLTDEEFQALEKALAACKVYGHRGHDETAQNTFSKHWLAALFSLCAGLRPFLLRRVMRMHRSTAPPRSSAARPHARRRPFPSRRRSGCRRGCASSASRESVRADESKRRALPFRDGR